MKFIKLVIMMKALLNVRYVFLNFNMHPSPLSCANHITALCVAITIHEAFMYSSCSSLEKILFQKSMNSKLLSRGN